MALLTGGRVKIGYQAGMRLLRSGAHLIVTTRFPRDSAARYAREPDFAQWAPVLKFSAWIYANTQRGRPLVNIDDKLTRLNLHQQRRETVRRPPAFYEHMMAQEKASLDLLPDAARELARRL